MRGDVMTFTKALPVATRTKKTDEPVEDDLPPPPVLEREKTEAPVKPKRAPRKKAIKDKTTD